MGWGHHFSGSGITERVGSATEVRVAPWVAAGEEWGLFLIATCVAPH